MVMYKMKWRFIVDNSKENSEIVVKLDINRKNRGNQNGGNNWGNTSGSIYCTYCRKPRHVKQNCLKFKRKNS
jgi:hypothetical protein